jgi:hypothetical protein
MTKDERLDLIDRLRRENDEGRERIRQRQEERESNPELEQDYLLAERPGASPLVTREAPQGIRYRQHENNAPAPAPSGDTAWSAWEGWLNGHLNILRQEMAGIVSEAIGIALAETRKEVEAEFERKLAALRTENAELKGRLGEVFAKLNGVESAIKNLTVDFRAESGVRDGLVRSFELQIAEMRGRLSAVLRDYAT